MSSVTQIEPYPGSNDPGFVSAIDGELDRLSQLQNNWDHEGAAPIDKAIIDAARRFVKALPDGLADRPRVVPMSAGNLQFEWHHGSKILELEFEDPQTIHFLKWYPERGIEEEDSFPATNINKAVDLIRWFMSGTLP